jgi:ubiquinone/menaquinone biosynthesis C-methylase UbiE
MTEATPLRSLVRSPVEVRIPPPAGVDLDLLALFIHENPFQPATCLWRALEIAFVAARGLPEGRGLDLACGDGRLFGLLAAQAGGRRKVVGLDLDPLEVASADRTGVYDRLVVASAAAIPEPDASFDWVFSNSALEHIPPIRETLAEAARILRPSGRFIFTVPSDELHACLHGPIIGKRDAYLRAIDERCAHLRYWSPDEWRRELASAGLELVSVERYLTGPEVRRWETLSRWTAGVLHAILRRPPIIIQRQLGMRRGQRLPLPLARLAARIITLGLDRRTDVSTGCLYVTAIRP